jgi:hypothetical protein
LASDDTAGDTITATNYTKALTVSATDENLDSNASTITGGTGSDTLAITITATNTILTSGVTNVETITLTGDDGAADVATITTADGLVADGASLTIDGSGLDQDSNDAVLTFNGSAEADGTFTITTAGAGAHTITLGQGNDTYTGSGSGNTTVTATGGNNTITTGTGADTITAGSGTDTITGGTGADIFAFGSAANAQNDSVTDFTSADDQIAVTLNYSTLLSGVVVNAVRTSTGVAGPSAAEATLTGQRGEYVYDTTNSKLLVNVTGDASISGADYQIGVNAATTAANTIAATDVNFTVTGTAYADTVKAGGGADTINGGAGIDTITGGAGADTINVGASDAVADIVSYDAETEGTAVVTITNVTTTADDFDAVAGTDTDSISNQWVTGTDDVRITFALAASGIGDSSTDTNWDQNTDGIWLIDNAQADLDGDNFGDVSDVITNFNIGNGTATNAAANDELIFTIENNSGDATGIYYWKDVDGNGSMNVGDQIALLGIVADASLVIGDFLYTGG